MKRLFCILLSLIAAFAASACSDPAAADAGTAETVGLVNGFEGQTDLDTVMLYGALGRVTVNDDAAYVREGAASARVTVSASPYKDAIPYLYQALALEKKEKNFTDFSRTQAVSVDVYNAGSAPSRVALQLVYPSGAGKRVWTTVQPGWTTVQLTVQREYIPKATDSADSELPVNGVRIVFERGEADGVYYLDALKVYFTDRPYTPILMTLGENEICSFDESWQTELAVGSDGGLEALAPVLEQVSDVTADGIGSALRIEAPPGTGSYTSTQRWPGVSLCQKMLTLVPWTLYPGSARFCFDVYAPEADGVDEIWLSLYSGSTRYFVSDTIPVRRGVWQTVSYTVSDINAQLKSTASNFASTTEIVVRWGEQTGAVRYLYLDNFRMEL